ncbi:hypothetical protein [Massilia sp. CF038]|uniref:hypothetical protein n=1 Tax=Massilia sp. CF038 TaxID=1881045 RepID=UPI00091D9292|nr:hypothetical protein [Massilia sp. CF038]SHG77679.1 hypothetical protein SAMN05428948_1988 [Massilia sp. CF038]
MSPFRHLFTVLLLVLMPFQAMGATYSNTAAPALAACESIIALAYYEDDGANGAACQAACSSAAVALAPPVMLIPQASKATAAAAVAGPALLPASHIPHGPQRPPCAQR